jgi:hypothetical protein
MRTRPPSPVRERGATVIPEPRSGARNPQKLTVQDRMRRRSRPPSPVGGARGTPTALMLRRAERPVSKHEGSRGYRERPLLEGVGARSGRTAGRIRPRTTFTPPAAASRGR